MEESTTSEQIPISSHARITSTLSSSSSKESSTLERVSFSSRSAATSTLSTSTLEETTSFEPVSFSIQPPASTSASLSPERSTSESVPPTQIPLSTTSLPTPHPLTATTPEIPPSEVPARATTPRTTSSVTPRPFLTSSTSSTVRATTSRAVTSSETSITSLGNATQTQESASSTTGPPNTTTALSSSPPALPLQCHHGGVLLGGQCQCVFPYAGRTCEEEQQETSPQNEFSPGIVAAEVNVTVKVDNWKYVPAMSDPSSSAFRKFSRMFAGEMSKIYHGIPGYHNVTVISLRNGSVIVDYKVNLHLLASGFNTSYEKSLGNLTEKLNKTRCSCSKCSNTTLETDSTCLQFYPVFQVTPVPLDLTAACTSRLPKEFQAYFLGESVNSSIQCFSSCSPRHPDPFRCGEGSCQIRSNGPNCFCPQSDSYWYTGWHCEQRVSKVGVAVGVALGLAVLLIVILVLAILLCWQRRTREPRLKNPSVGEETWYENDPEWSPPWMPRPHGPARDDSSSTSINVPDPDGRSSSEDGRSSPPGQGIFRPRLDKVDTSLQARIARPQVTHL